MLLYLILSHGLIKFERVLGFRECIFNWKTKDNTGSVNKPLNVSTFWVSNAPCDTLYTEGTVELVKLCVNFYSVPFSSTDGTFSLQREVFSTVRTSSSMELLPASLSFLSSAPFCFHFPCSAWLNISSWWSKEACNGLQWLPEFSPLRNIENRDCLDKTHLKSETGPT